MASVGKHIKHLRTARNMTQEQLAEQLGVTRAAVGMWEIGRSWPSAALLPQMADLLLCSIDDLYHVPANDTERGDEMLCQANAAICTEDTGALPA